MGFESFYEYLKLVFMRPWIIKERNLPYQREIYMYNCYLTLGNALCWFKFSFITFFPWDNGFIWSCGVVVDHLSFLTLHPVDRFLTEEVFDWIFWTIEQDCSNSSALSSFVWSFHWLLSYWEIYCELQNVFWCHCKSSLILSLYSTSTLLLCLRHIISLTFNICRYSLFFPAP